MQVKTLPPFVREYETDGAKFCFTIGSPIRANLVYKFLLTICEESAMSQPEIESFLILEGHLYSHELDSEQHPSLAYYLNMRKFHSGLAALWEAYQGIQVDDILLVYKAFYVSRSHTAETMKDLSEDEKKSESSQKLTSTLKQQKPRATDTKKSKKDISSAG